MNRIPIRITAIISILLLTLFPPNDSTADQADTNNGQLVGTWALVLVDNLLPDGSRIHLYGLTPLGRLTFDEQGRYSLQIYRANRATFAINDKSKGTPEENSAALLGANSHFGRYSINTADRTVIFQIEHASFPNWDGTEQKRSFAIESDRLRYTVPTPTSGGTAIGEVVWKRAP